MSLALPVAPTEGLGQAELMAGVGEARRAAQLVLAALRGGAGDRLSVLRARPVSGRSTTTTGDPVDPAVWRWRVDPDWVLTPERPLAGYS